MRYLVFIPNMFFFGIYRVFTKHSSKIQGAIRLRKFLYFDHFSNVALFPRYRFLDFYYPTLHVIKLHLRNKALFGKSSKDKTILKTNRPLKYTLYIPKILSYISILTSNETKLKPVQDNIVQLHCSLCR